MLYQLSYSRLHFGTRTVEIIHRYGVRIIREIILVASPCRQKIVFFL
ncbi:conserved hypothetical protein [Xenorhabdus nematophila F1]|uniref:Uncharacterized protein n=1 Tax=Xenorhabdus nematophila (strain ATCC 19061 / DSM 3370 / CCUG 14189 / LMG 1036 / NCIMB 9965 / AN6) TaxID=406817 RepID=D3VI24_XENNA|nr:hypothetical protein XNC1_0436 [Xenorhabdus nematophila ATCC 19061]CCW29683.1 conserved hypothetical protein [Xenorhabdus nematophila F1]CEE94868.1 hypothetical protein XNA1_4820003 [Xenorhabdus nematophila str. Anatoliense]CEF31593.1 hypothetical protein XNW1_3850089 [Xenorhabdus nematophila str. Websteri]CEK21426.1 hypothetical protein XNC2_0427 [Xenorhabdus nematophila AN6/1]